MLKKNKGFTIIEAVIACAIISILAMIFVPIIIGLKHDLTSKSTTEVTVQTEETKVVEQPKTTIKEPTENKTEKKDLEKL